MNKRQENSPKFYKRVHDAEKTSADAGNASNLDQYLYAAATDDGLGWSLPDERIDPMYTMNRREQEKEQKDKDLLRKRFKSAIVQQEDEEPKEKKTKKNDTSLPGMMAFGFGMVPPPPSSKKKKKKSKSKSKETASR